MDLLEILTTDKLLRREALYDSIFKINYETFELLLKIIQLFGSGQLVLRVQQNSTVSFQQLLACTKSLY